MLYALIVTAVLVFLTLVVAGILVFSARNVSIKTLKEQNRVGEIINILLNNRSEIKRRLEALDVLVEIGSPEAITAMLGLLGTHDPLLGGQLIERLADLGPQIYPGLRQSFLNSYSRPGVLKVLAKIGPQGADVVLPLLKYGNPAIRNAAILALEAIAWTPGMDAASADYWIIKHLPENCGSVGPAAVPALLEALKEPALIPGAVEALGEIGDTSAGWPLLEAARDPKYKPRVIKAIVKWKESGLPLLFAAMKEGDPVIRQVAVNTLDVLAWRPGVNEIGAWYWALKNNLEKCIQIGPAAVGPLLKLLDQKEKDIQGEIITTLGVIGDESALNGLLGLLNHADYERRKTILEALGDFKQAATVDVLIEALGDKNLANTAAKSLEQVGGPAVAALTRILAAPDRKMRLHAAEILEKLKWKPESDGQMTLFWIARQDWKKCVDVGVGAVEMLIGELGQEDTCVEATRALVEIGDTRAVIPIIHALTGKSSSIQHEMAESLGRLATDPDLTGAQSGEAQSGEAQSEIRTAVVAPLLAELNQGTMELAPIILALGETRDERGARPLTEYLKSSYPVSIREAAAQALGKIGLPAVEPIFEVMQGAAVDPRAAGVALGGVGPAAQKRLIAALKNKTYDAQVLIYALGKIGGESSARVILDTLVGTQYGHEIQNTAQTALYGIGVQSIKPIIEGFVRHPDAEAVLTSMLVHYGQAAVEPLVWALGKSNDTKQVESIIIVLGEIGDVRAANPLINMLKRSNINASLVNEALDKIRKMQRTEKERMR